ncbi:hypothetical protein [Hymenobacter sp. CRA2]|uniref:hypothetical protein n=1 Tax=Hymenobacter sp. CRA2 TaxID=1955620 RepID=UPI00098F32AC|nr:hypothetical protein [Hymenobacter sp. CRA2]OON66866.1 hypothetical protein B0919_21135 [Hymenobacter sp. CRA2]
MKLRFLLLSVLVGLGLAFTACQDDDDPQLQCVEATVVGRHCASGSGSYGFVLNLSQPNTNAQAWVDSVGNQYSFAVTAINLPAALRQPGKKVYFAAHQATESEKSALGPRTTQCAAPPPLVTIEVAQDKPCQ